MNRIIVSTTPIEWLDTVGFNLEINEWFALAIVNHFQLPCEMFVNNNTTVCKFADGKVITSKPRDGEPFDLEMGVAMCIVKKLYGGRGKWLKALNDKVKFQERKVKK
jgi:hypothetical protein